MRREGFEIQLGQPKVIIKEIDGKRNEPIEALTVQVPEEFSGKVIELVTMRKGDILNIEVAAERAHLEFNIPARGVNWFAKSNVNCNRRGSNYGTPLCRLRTLER